MDNDLLLTKVAKLPEHLQSEVVDFIDFLLLKKTSKAEGGFKPVFGSGKGMFAMRPDFDNPLDDFKDYM